MERRGFLESIGLAGVAASLGFKAKAETLDVPIFPVAPVEPRKYLLTQAWVAKEFAIALLHELDGYPLIYDPDRQDGKRIYSSLEKPPGFETMDCEAARKHYIYPAARLIATRIREERFTHLCDLPQRVMGGDASSVVRSMVWNVCARVSERHYIETDTTRLVFDVRGARI